MTNAATNPSTFTARIKDRGLTLKHISDLVGISYTSMRRLAHDPAGAPLLHAFLVAECCEIDDIEDLFSPLFTRIE